VESSICGQAGSDPAMAEWLVEHGIESLSANIDAVAKIRDRVARTEQRMILDAARRTHA
jgi:pyruvate,water dikinase